MLNHEINQNKLNLNEVYNLRDPKSYYKMVNRYKYNLPEEAKPYFRQIIDAYCCYESINSLKILDLGCSYGINSAILKFNKTISELYRYYTNPIRFQLSESSCRNLDYTWFHESDFDKNLQFIGLDNAKQAVDYAIESKLIETGIYTDLEKFPLSEIEHANLQDIDLLISTGCIGYITEITFSKILPSFKNIDKLWGAIFVLKMFDTSELNKLLTLYNLALVSTGITVKQRKFASIDEKKTMIDFIERRGLRTELERQQNNLFAELFLILPFHLLNQKSIKTLFSFL